MANVNQIIKISKTDYIALVAAGSSGYVIDGTRYYYDENNIYLIEASAEPATVDQLGDQVTYTVSGSTLTITAKQ